jgi:hypothetical protein
MNLCCFSEYLLLLGNCFWREGFEAAFGPDRMGEKGGYIGRDMNWLSRQCLATTRAVSATRQGL